MIDDFSFQHLRFHLEPKGPLQMPAYNKGNVIRGGFGRGSLSGSCNHTLENSVRLEALSQAANTFPHWWQVRNFSSDLILSVVNFTASVGSLKRTVAS
jgi:hypothetical protein